MTDLDLTIEAETDSIGIPFSCPSCEQEVIATLADPFALLFGGGTIELVCPECETAFQADISTEESE
jgi:hypothetical protein